MGIPIQTPMGATGGAGIFTAIDNSAELGAIAAELATIAAALTTMITVNESKYWGTAALAVPGSPAASLANISSMLADMNRTIIDLRKNQEALAGAIGELSSAQKHQTKVNEKIQAMQAVALADQIETNRFTKDETIAALQRNGIEPQPQPNILEVMKEKLVHGTQFSLSTDFSTTIQNIGNKALSELSDYITNTTVYTYGQAQLTNLWAKLGLNKVAAAAADPAKVAADAAKTAAAAAAKSGVWTPSVTPPNP